MVVQWVPEVLGGRYEVHRELGSGGTAVVLEATDRVLGRRVAVKVLFPHLAGDPAFVQRFQQEARSAAQLSHPNIVAIYDVGSHQGPDADEIDFIVMEFVEGRTLREELASGPLPPERAAAVARDVAAALQAAHAGGVVHRDIKPANAMLAHSGQVKVMDFGLARATDAIRLTQTGLVIATAQYASPEQLQGQDVDARSDVYSLGCCLYEMLAGTAPFAGGTPISVAFRQVNEAPVALRERDPQIPAGLAAVAARAMEKDPARRYPSAAELGADLSRVLAGEQPLAVIGAADTAPIGATALDPGAGEPRDPLPEEAAEPGWAAAPRGPGSGRRRLLAAGAIAVAGVLAAGFGLRLLADPQPPPAAPGSSPSVTITPTAPAAPTAAVTRSAASRSAPRSSAGGRPTTTPAGPPTTTTTTTTSPSSVITTSEVTGSTSPSEPTSPIGSTPPVSGQRSSLPASP